MFYHSSKLWWLYTFFVCQIGGGVFKLFIIHIRTAFTFYWVCLCVRLHVRVCLLQFASICERIQLKINRILLPQHCLRWKKQIWDPRQSHQTVVYLLEYMNRTDLFISYKRKMRRENINIWIVTEIKKTTSHCVIWHLYAGRNAIICFTSNHTGMRTQFYCVSLNINFNCREFSCRA